MAGETDPPSSSQPASDSQTQNIKDEKGSWRKKKKLSKSERERSADVLDEIRTIQTQWYCCFLGWTTLHYALGLGATFIAVALSTVKTGTSDTSMLISFIDKNRDLLGVINACMTAALTFLKAQEKSSSYIAAWRQLNVARIAYIHPQIEKDPLVSGYRDGEELIQKSD